MTVSWWYMDEFDEFKEDNIARGGSWRNYSFEYRNPPLRKLFFIMNWDMGCIIQYIEKLIKMEE